MPHTQDLTIPLYVLRIMGKDAAICVGFISRWAIEDASSLSGIPASVWQSLCGHGLKLVKLEVKDPKDSWIVQQIPWAKVARSVVPAAYRWGIRRHWNRFVRQRAQLFEYRRILTDARARSERLTRLIAQHRLDALFGICISTELYALHTRLPIIYASDATAHLINTTYPDYMARAPAYHRACDHIEATALSRVSAAIFASQRSFESAVDDYDVPQDRAHIVPMGAHVVPDDPVDPTGMSHPTRDHTELILIASDPVRKRLNLCIDVCEALAHRGLIVRLNYIGPYTPRAVHCPLVHCAGSLSLSNAEDRAAHKRLLQRSHLLILPSTGEMYGIAACEAAHFGRPSLVSDAGGLPTVVLDNVTGLVMPVSCQAARYADKIEGLCHDPGRYRAMAHAALQRSHDVLNWATWGRRTAGIIRNVVEAHRQAS